MVSGRGEERVEIGQHRFQHGDGSPDRVTVGRQPRKGLFQARLKAGRAQALANPGILTEAIP